ncbi:hypothetical protein B0A49_05153 [Cryomyces minteri]|uniref:Dihydrolipoamide acetyltransferase component of pyruvate dehydrogenase complex n=2 Tax=Cryomyces minteri TaxID=331657 RepID=A0A4U0WYS2_9PEZI|nr:hypothetical protein B0A49_05153 [Cryomyces minteri]
MLRGFDGHVNSYTSPILLRQHFRCPTAPRQYLRRAFHASRRRDVVKPMLLADIGEGIRECQIIQWFVQPGARVEEWDPLCEVQSDKASTEISSRFTGVVTKLHYDADDVAIVGKPLVDIDIQGEISPKDEALLGSSSNAKVDQQPEAPSAVEKAEEVSQQSALVENKTDEPLGRTDTEPLELERAPPSKHATLATPAVRHLTKELKVNIADVTGTGKDGRVLKEDVQKFASHDSLSKQSATPAAQAHDRVVPLTPIQQQMFKTMTRSLNIPHFLYTTPVDLTSLTALRRKLNTSLDQSQKLTPLPFILKAVSLALTSHRLLNTHLDTATNPQKPQLTYHASHDIGVAVDTPSGLLVPVIRNVQDLSVHSIALELARLSGLARAGKLSAADMAGATFTVSNVGSIGGGVVAPVITSPQVAILGVGRSRVVPAFGEAGELVRREEAVFSWSADHRVVDGAECARAAETVRGFLEGVEGMLVRLR